MNCTECLGEQVLSNCVNIAKNNSTLKSTTLTKLVEEIDAKFPKEELFNGKNLIKNNASQAEKNQFFVDEIVGLKNTTKSDVLSEKIGIDLSSVDATLTKGSYTIGEILIAMSNEIKNLKTRINQLETDNVY